LTITGCTRESSVVVDGRNGTESTEVSVAFVDVGFVQNGRIDIDVRGAGIRIEACLEENCTRPEVNITRCTFANKALFLDGRGPVLELQSCTFTANKASNMSIPANSSLFDDSNLLDGASTRGGGAVFVESPLQLTVIDSNFSENTASLAGGAIRLEFEGLNDQVESTVNVFFEGNTFYKNSVSSLIDVENGLQPTQLELSSAGGALFMRSHSTTAQKFLLQRSTFEQNSGFGGGALYIQSLMGSTQNVISCLFTGNEADGLGGAILVSDASLMVNGSTFIQNKARTGGGIFVLPNSNVIAGPDIATGNLTVFEHNIALNVLYFVTT